MMMLFFIGHFATITHNRGPKTIVATAAAASAAHSTAPAATSLARPASGCGSGETRSTTASIAVFTPSAVQTRPMAAVTAHHSPREMRNQNPAATASTVAVAWMRALACVRRRMPMPRKAQPKLRAKRPCESGGAGGRFAHGAAGYLFSGKNFGASPSGFAASRFRRLGMPGGFAFMHGLALRCRVMLPCPVLGRKFGGGVFFTSRGEDGEGADGDDGNPFHKSAGG